MINRRKNLGKIMTWYKQSKLETFIDRNYLNGRIRSFKELVKKLKYLQKYIVQNAPHARETLDAISKDKRMSSFPDIVKKMKAATLIALDNYDKFAQLCLEIMDDVVREVVKMEKERDNFVKKIHLKGLKDDNENTKKE